MSDTDAFREPLDESRTDDGRSAAQQHQFGVERLRETLGSVVGSSPDEIVAHVTDAVGTFSSDTLADDIALMVVRAA